MPHINRQSPLSPQEYRQNHTPAILAQQERRQIGNYSTLAELSQLIETEYWLFKGSFFMLLARKLAPNYREELHLLVTRETWHRQMWGFTPGRQGKRLKRIKPHKEQQGELGL